MAVANQNARNVEQLRQQAQAVRFVAEKNGDSSVAALSFQAAATLDAWASKQEQRLNTATVLELESNASDAELRAARVRQAVKRGTEVFLPTWRDATVGLPNLLLRSELFRAANTAETSVPELVIASQGDTSITFTGVRLNDYDRRVFAACLTHYRMDCPLSSGRDGDFRWIRTTFYQISLALGVTYGENVCKAIRASLIRLNAAHLRIRAKGQNIPMPRLLDVAFEESDPGSKSKDKVAFRVLEPMANLFGHAEWSAVSTAALNDYSGLAAWLAGFYSTHKSVYPIRISDLYRYSGAVCTPREFRRRLKNALTQLQGAEVPEAIRIAKVETKGGAVEVTLLRWGSPTVGSDKTRENESNDAARPPSSHEESGSDAGSCAHARLLDRAG